MVQNAWKKITENLGFVKNSKFFRGSTEAAVCECFSINSQKNTCIGVLYIKFEGIKSVTLLQ